MASPKLNINDAKKEFPGYQDQTVDQIITIYNNASRLRKEIINLINQLSQVTRADELDVVSGFVSRIKLETLTSLLCANLLKYKEQIEGGNEEFFVQNSDEIFKGISPNRITYFKDIWSNKLSEENKEVVKDYFKLFLRLSERHSQLTALSKTHLD
jgi:hypothetical protein